MKKWLVRISLGIVVLTIVSAVTTFFVINDAVDTMFGGKTVAAEPIIFGDSPSRYVLANVSVLVPSGEAFLARQSVRVENGLIKAVGPRLENVEGLDVIDGSGLFVVPGYTDSHVHLWNSPNDLLLYLAKGVTQVREMHGRPHHLRWRKEINAGRLGPELYVVAAQLATYGLWEGLWNRLTSKRNVVRTPERTERAIRALQRQGYDAVKASSFLSLENYRAASEASRELGIPLVGHIPLESDLAELWASNQREVAHIEEIVKALNREFGGYRSTDANAFLDHVRARRDVVARKLANNGITIVSTLALIESFRPQIVDLDATLAGTELAYVNPGVAEGQAMGWLPDVNRYRIPKSYRTGDWQERQSTYWHAYAEAHRLVLEALLLEDVAILAGTDANVPVMVPGFSMHEEMQALVAAGMTPTQVLASATRAPGDWMGWKTGQVREGFRANLVLLRENPLEDIDATDAIEMVVIHGRMLSRDDLDALLRAVKDANEASRTVTINPL